MGNSMSQSEKQLINKQPKNDHIDSTSTSVTSNNQKAGPINNMQQTQLLITNFINKFKETTRSDQNNVKKITNEHYDQQQETRVYQNFSHLVITQVTPIQLNSTNSKLMKTSNQVQNMDAQLLLINNTQTSNDNTELNNNQHITTHIFNNHNIPNFQAIQSIKQKFEIWFKYYVINENSSVNQLIPRKILKIPHKFVDNKMI